MRPPRPTRTSETISARRHARALLFLFLAMPLFALPARKYYFSSTDGDDVLNNGTSAVSPWRTIAKLNSVSGSLVAGDSIFFKCGDVFPGAVAIIKSGVPGNPIVITSYSTGARPLISGMVTLGAWTNTGGNIWTTSGAALKSTVSILTINGTAQVIARTPNTTYTPYQSATTTTLTATALTGAPSYVGSEIVIKKNSFTITRSPITVQSGTTVTYISPVGIDNNNPLTPIAGKVNFGYFIQKHTSCLDVQGEWMKDPTTGLVMLYSTIDPNTRTIKASSIDTLLSLARQSNITVDGLAFEGGGMYGTESHGNGVTVRNCTFDNNTRAVYVWNGSDITITNNTVRHAFNSGITIGFNSTTPSLRLDVSNNLVTNTGEMVGVGVYPSNNNLKAIVVKSDSTRANNFVNIKNNVVLYTGYMGIEFQGSNVLVQHNYVARYDSTLDDGGAIYSFKSIPASNVVFSNRVVDNNLVGDAIGAPSGTDRTTPDVAGLYYDEQTDNIVTTNNGIFNVPGNGIQMNSPLNMVITGNGIWNCDYAILLAKKPIREVSGVTITRNQIYQKTTAQYNFFHINGDLTKPSTMTWVQSLTNLWLMDSNYISNFQSNGYDGYYTATTGGTTTFIPAFSLATWRGTYGHDTHSTLPPVTQTTTNTTMVVNPSDTVMVYQHAGLKKIEPDGTDHSNTTNIPRFSFKILQDNGTAVVVNLPPTARIAAVADITLPTSQVTLTSTSTDADGTIPTQVWAQTTAGTGTITSTGATSTTVTGLTAGAYQYRLIVTDNGGLKDTAYVNFNVIPAAPANIPPTVTATPADTTITLPASTSVGRAVGADQDGTIGSYAWRQLNGPGIATIVSPASATTTFSGLVEGQYNFEVTVKDNHSPADSAKTTVHITVLPALVNVAPVPNAGRDTLLTLPANSTVLTGGATATNATISTYQWTVFSGPGGSAFGTPAAASTTFTGLAAGTYKVRLTVVDSHGMTAYDEATVVVDPAVVYSDAFILFAWP